MALNRTLILPQFTCYCDEIWYWSLEVNPGYKCRYIGARNQTLPFACPHDHIVNLLQLDDEPSRFGAAVRYRESSFMENSRTPNAIKVRMQDCMCTAWHAFWFETIIATLGLCDAVWQVETSVTKLLSA